MKGKMLLAVLAAFSVSAYSDILVQEDWTGGEGIWGPVIEWGSVFFESAGVTYSEPGEVHLDYLYSEDQIAGNFQGAYELREADIDGDGDLDIVCAASIADKIKWWENIDGTGGSWQGHLIAGNLNMACSVDCADVDGDGDTDILSSNNGGTMGNMRWWENTDGTGSSWTEHSMGEEYWAGGGISAGDPDGDGDQDILTSYVMDDKIVWWENSDGSGCDLIEHVVAPDYDGPGQAGFVDIDGDGNIDIVSAAWWGNDISWWESSDTTPDLWFQHCIDPSAGGAYCARPGDIDGDGDIDLVGANQMDNQIVWYENIDASGDAWVKHVLDGEFITAVDAFPADIDGDGDIDIAGASSTSGDKIAWWENVGGNGTEWLKHTVCTDFMSAHSVRIADLNSDGKQDILAAAMVDNDIAWWEVSFGTGTLESSVIDMGEPAEWLSLDCVAQEPNGSSVRFLVRASDDPMNMGAWSDTLSAPADLTTVLSEGDNCFQYKAIFNSSEQGTIPLMSSFTAEWQQLAGIYGENELSDLSITRTSGNPSNGTLSIELIVNNPSVVDLEVFDLTGRTVFSVSGSYSPGIHSVVYDNARPGVYFIRIAANEESMICRSIVID